MKTSDTLTKIAPALVAALSKIEGAAKTATNGGFKTKYATLETVIDASRDILSEHGLTLIQLPGACASGVMNLETVFMHESGEWISGEMGIALGKTDPQGVGSALTYARRYAQMAALNMPAVDDDAEHAMGRGKREEPAPRASELAINLLRACVRSGALQGSLGEEQGGLARRHVRGRVPRGRSGHEGDRSDVRAEGGGGMNALADLHDLTFTTRDLVDRLRTLCGDDEEAFLDTLDGEARHHGSRSRSVRWMNDQDRPGPGHAKP
jgi:hypothetical protein